MGPPLNSTFLVRRGGLVGGTTKLSLLVKEARISGGPTILKCMYTWILEKSKCPHKCMLIVLLCKGTMMITQRRVSANRIYKTNLSVQVYCCL